VNPIYQPKKLKEELMCLLDGIEIEVKGLKGHINQAVYCDDIITSISNIQSQLNLVRKKLLESHFKSCVVESLQEGDVRVIENVMVTIQKMMK
jgi:CsoR family transcriptional regulator, copper-sensing transcriptional repressor